MIIKKREQAKKNCESAVSELNSNRVFQAKESLQLALRILDEI